MLPILDDLPIVLDEILLFEESDIDWCDNRDDLAWEKLLTPACVFSGPSLVSPASLEAIVATCPAESVASQEHYKANVSTGVGFSPLNPWVVAGNYVSTHKVKILNAIAPPIASPIASLDRTFCDFFDSIRESGIETLHSKSLVDASAFSIKMLEKLIPTVLRSQRQSTLEPVQVLSAETDVSGTNEFGSDADADADLLIGHAGATQDSYWQYYEDCDRWGVDFAGLLIEANATGNSQFYGEPTNEQSVIGSISPQCLLARVIATQNVSIWFYCRTRIENRLSSVACSWLELVQFNDAEAVETGFALIERESQPGFSGVSTISSSIPGIGLAEDFIGLASDWMFVSEIIRFARAEYFWTRMAKLDSDGGSTNNK